MRVKNWQQFQHFKDRRPPWVKLYRDLLDDPEWHALDCESAKVLVSLWLIASDDKTLTGTLPDTKKLAFMLRMSELQTKKVCLRLSHWLVQDDIDLISSRHQLDAPETETETETETERRTAKRSPRHVLDEESFSIFWKAYPRKVAKPGAMAAFARINGSAPDLLPSMLAAIERQGLAAECAAGRAQYVPHPATWINGRRWEDQDAMPADLDAKRDAEFEARRQADEEHIRRAVPPPPEILAKLAGIVKAIP